MSKPFEYDRPLAWLRVCIYVSLILARPVNEAAKPRMIRRLVTDVSELIQFPDAFMISRNRCNPTVGHQCFPVNGKWILKATPLPANEQAGEQAYMGGEYTTVCAHAPYPFAVISRFLLNAYAGHC